jgi:hypothetical protein
LLGAFFCFFLMYVIQHCFICRPSDFSVSEDAGTVEYWLRWIRVRIKFWRNRIFFIFFILYFINTVTITIYVHSSCNLSQIFSTNIVYHTDDSECRLPFLHQSGRLSLWLYRIRNT